MDNYDVLVKSLETIEDHAVLTLDRHGNVLNWNHGARRIKGFFPEEVIGNHFSVFYPEEDRNRRMPDHHLQIAAEKGRLEIEGYRVRKNGERFWANIVLTAVKDNAGRVIAFSKVTRDLMDRKLIDQKLKQSEERYRLLLDNIKDYAIIMLDQHGLISSWNSGALAINGYEEAEIIGKHFSIFYTSEDIADGFPQRHLELARGLAGRSEDIGWRMRKDGTRMWVNVVMNAIRDEKGTVVGFSHVTRDITEKKKIEDLEDSIRMRDEFISVASHELRTPLTKVLLHLQLMKKNSDLSNEKLMKSLDVSEAAAKELAGIMDNLVDVTRLRLGKLEIRRTKTNVCNVVKNVITKFKDEIRLGGISLHFHHEGDIIGYWDQVRLEQLISNLLSNAIKYGNSSPIRMELKLLEENVIFSIADEGPGIPYDLQPRIFERFERAVGSRNISGLGLGLYVARQIISAHKGDISLESHPGKGARFTFRLPLKQDSRRKFE